LIRIQRNGLRIMFRRPFDRHKGEDNRIFIDDEDELCYNSDIDDEEE